jgi:hypothetical protein
MHSFVIWLYFLIPLISYGQENLVVNWSFEDMTECPWSPAGISYGCCADWTTGSASPDYYNTCSPQGWVSVPSNIYGFQYASTGRAYAGIITYSRNDTIDSTLYWGREVLAGKLSSPLVIGLKYFVSLKASMTMLWSEEGCAANKIGALFRTTPYIYTSWPPYTKPIPVTNFAQVYSDQVILDSVNWTTITGSFIADSAYKYIYIGNFFDNAHTDSIVLDTNWFNSCAYYYIDDVCVSLDSFTCNIAEPVYPPDEDIIVFPNPAEDLLLIRLTNNADKLIEIKVFDAIGRLVDMPLINTSYYGDDDYYIDLTDYRSGVYLINITSNKRNKTMKIIHLNKS